MLHVQTALRLKGHTFYHVMISFNFDNHSQIITSAGHIKLYLNKVICGNIYLGPHTAPQLRYSNNLFDTTATSQSVSEYILWIRLLASQSVNHSVS